MVLPFGQCKFRIIIRVRFGSGLLIHFKRVMVRVQNLNLNPNPQIEIVEDHHVWDPHQNYLTRKVESVQRRAARFVTNTPYRYDQPDSMTAIIRDLKWESLESRREKASLTMLHKIVNHTVQVPQEYHPTSDTSKYNTHSSNNSRRFTKYQPRLNAYLHSFFPRTVNLWNSLQNEVVTATTVDQFKSGLATRSPL